MTETFNRGDLVRTQGGGSPWVEGDEAIVLKRSGGDYAVYIHGQGEAAWFSNLTLIERNRLDLLEQWKNEDESEATLKGDLNWVFTHGPEVLADPHPASVQALATCFGLEDLWGAHGEGVVYYSNFWGTLQAAQPYLETNDHAGWMTRAEEIRKNVAIKMRQDR